MRLILSVEPSIPTVERIVLLQEELDSPMHHLGCDVRWTPADAIRLNLKIVPNAEESMILRMREQLRTIARSRRPFDVSWMGASFYPSLARPRMVTTRATQGGGELEAIRRQVEAAFEAQGLAPDSRPWEPQILVGRVGSERDAPRLDGVLDRYEETPFGETHVRELVLFKTSVVHGEFRSDVVNRFELGRGT